jgi:hypothetical protein
LRADGAELGQSDTSLRVSVSENPSDFLLVARFNAQVLITTWKRPPPAPKEYAISLRIAAVWQQRTPILDLLLFNNGAGMIVLEPERIAQYTRNGGDWRFDRATPVTLSRPAPRDPRGRLVGAPPAVDVSEPGHNGAEPARFPYHWVAGRNFFEGGERGNFFTAAELPAGTLLAGIDGRARWYTQKPEPSLLISDWGSDVAAIASNCGSKMQVLATAPVTDGAPDRLQAFEIAGASYAAVTEAVLLPGVVTALWPAESPDQVTMVVENRQTGMYEASRISLVCSK